jgi:hypothetical protein
MNKPLQRLRQLPWIPLLLVALLTLFWASVLELALLIGSSRVALVQNALSMLFRPPLDVILLFGIAMGIGALAVVFLEILYPQLLINSGVLWALLFCLLVAMLFRTLLPIETGLLQLNSLMLTGNLLGVFFKGKPYWR